MIPLGFSDHTIGHLASALAVTFGACLLEKHITIDRNLPGPDHWFAEDAVSLTTYVNSIRTAYKMMGNPALKPTKKEEELKKMARRSIITLKEIKKDEMLDDSNIGLRRPGTGLPPKLFPTVLGKIARRDLPKAKILDVGDFR
jgi:sialic acid synthase SpsE